MPPANKGKGKSMKVTRTFVKAEENTKERVINVFIEPDEFENGTILIEYIDKNGEKHQVISHGKVIAY